MNFMPATVKGDQVELPFGTVKLSAEKAAKVKDKGLLIAGIRPEHFEDAAVIDRSVADRGSIFRANVDVVEWLGHEAYAYIPFDAPPEVSSQLSQLEKDLDSEALQRFVVAMFEADKIVGAICHGTVVAARAIVPSTGRSAHSVPSRALFALSTYAWWCLPWWISIVCASMCGSSAE